MFQGKVIISLEASPKVPEKVRTISGKRKLELAASGAAAKAFEH